MHLSEGGGFSPTCGFVPEGGSCSQKQNVAGSTVRGVESNLTWRPHPLLDFEFAHIWSQSEFQQSDAPAGLAGKRFPHAPEHRFIAGLRWRILNGVVFSAHFEYWDAQYENAVNTIELGDFSLLRLGLNYRISERLQVTLSAENALETEVVTGIRGDGTVNIGRGRTLLGALHYKY